MSVCLGGYNEDKPLCYGCGKEVDYSKGHITMHFTSRQITSGEDGYRHNHDYNLTLHGLECLSKVDWKKVAEEILRIEKRDMEHKWKDIHDFGI